MGDQKICQSCGNSYSKIGNDPYWSRKKYCSPLCQSRGLMNTFSCEKCGKNFRGRARYKPRFCSKSCAAVRQNTHVVPYEKSLEALYPKVAEHWFSERNGISAKEVFAKSQKKYWFWCGKPGHEHYSIVSSKVYSKNVCQFCSGQKVSKENNFKVMYPEIAAEWHPTKNDKKPSEVTFGSSYNAWWMCQNGHEWSATVNSRTNHKSSCSKCNNQSSRQEIRLLTELMWIFGEVVSREKISGFEVDVYIPKLKIGIEFDGSYWHKDKTKKDLQKNKSLGSVGVKVLRVREEPLEKLSPSDILVDRNADIKKTDVDQLIKAIGINTDNVNDYLLENTFVNEETFRIYLDYFPSPFPEYSFAVKQPDIAAEWHPTKNSPLTPRNFSEKSGFLAYWKCEKGHEWQQTIHARVGRNIGCGYCSGRYATFDDNIEATHPNIVKLWHPTKNKNIIPSQIKRGSGKKLWWKCDHNSSHIWQETPLKMTQRQYEDYCIKCYQEFEDYLKVLFSQGYSAQVLADFFNLPLSQLNYNLRTNKKRTKRPRYALPNRPWEAPTYKRNKPDGLEGSPITSEKLGYFISISEAARAVELPVNTVSYRISSGWSVDQALGLKPPPNRKYLSKNALTVNGISYPSIKAAAIAYNKDPSWSAKKLKKGFKPEEVFRSFDK